MNSPAALPMVEKHAIDIARAYYGKWGPKLNTFTQELAEYLESGMVFVRPDLFMMAKIVDFGEGPVWYVRMAVGKLRELVYTLPIVLPKVYFQRHGDMRLREYSLERIERLVAAQDKKEKENGQG